MFIGETELQEIEKELQETENEELRGIKNKKQLLRLVRRKYLELLATRQEEEIQNLANLTGWEIKNIRNRVNSTKAKPKPWWRKLWN